MPELARQVKVIVFSNGCDPSGRKATNARSGTAAWPLSVTTQKAPAYADRGSRSKKHRTFYGKIILRRWLQQAPA